MGSPFSKNPNPLIAESSDNVGYDAATTTSTINNNAGSSTTTKIELVSELSSYEAACQQDPELQSFDATLHQRTSHVISTLAAGIDLHSLSFDTLREVTGCLLDMNQEVVKIILDYKKDIWSNPELFSLVEEYFENSLQTLDFCTALEKCLKRARDSRLIIHVALKRFAEEEEEEEVEDGIGRRKYERTLEALRRFKAAEEPFTEEFFQVFHSVYGQQVSMLEKLRKKKKMLDKKLKSMQAWRKLSSVIFISVFAGVLICSVVAAAMTAPPVITTLAASATVAMAPVGKWLNSLWNEYLVALKGQKEVLKTMQVGTYVTISDLESIRVLVNQLECLITALLQSVDFVLKEEEAVRFVIEEIKKKLEMFMKSVEELGRQADRCSRDIRKARTVVLQRIIRQPK